VKIGPITVEKSHITRHPHPRWFAIDAEMSCLPGYDSVAMALFPRHHDPVDAILSRHGLRGPWQELPATGIANRIYATDDLVLRVAVEGSEALNDARTESVAAPVARAAGVLVPRLIAFDESGSIVDRPYSLWERAHGETLGLFALELAQVPFGATPFVLQGYGLEAHLHDAAEARMLWDKLCKALEQLEQGDVQCGALDNLLAYTSRIA